MMRSPSGEVKASIGSLEVTAAEWGLTSLKLKCPCGAEMPTFLMHVCTRLTKINLEMPRPQEFGVNLLILCLHLLRWPCTKTRFIPVTSSPGPRLPTLLAHCFPCSLGSGRSAGCGASSCQGYSFCHQPVVLENKCPSLSALFLPTLKYHCSLVARNFISVLLRSVLTYLSSSGLLQNARLDELKLESDWASQGEEINNSVTW